MLLIQSSRSSLAMAMLDLNVESLEKKRPWEMMHLAGG